MAVEKRFSQILALNSYYSWKVYEIYDCKGFQFLLAEPIGATGMVTRSAKTINELYTILQKDIIFMNYVHKHEKIR